MATDKEFKPQRRMEDRHPDAKIDWDQPGAPVVPQSSTAGAAKGGNTSSEEPNNWGDFNKSCGYEEVAPGWFKKPAASQVEAAAPLAGDDSMIEQAVKANNVYGVLPNSASTMSIGRAVLAAERRRVAAPVQAPMTDAVICQSLGDLLMPKAQRDEILTKDSAAQAPQQIEHQSVDEIVTALYRRFKDWSKRGFGPDDVTWCEVKADVIELIKAEQVSPSASADGWIAVAMHLRLRKPPRAYLPWQIA